MSGSRKEQSDDLVSRAVAATRRLPLPSGLSPTVVSQTLAALREAESRPRATFLQRVYNMPWTSKAITVLATAASLLAVYAGLSGLTGSALAFADVVEVLNKVRSATWKTTTEAQGPDNQSLTWTGVGMFLAPSHERTEISAQGQKTIQIMDGQKNKAVSLIPAMKTAVVFELKNLPPKTEGPFGKTFQGLREMIAKAKDEKDGHVEPLGIETIDGRRADGFRIELGAIEIKIWADAKTLLPVRVEHTTTSGPKVHILMTDFQTDVNLDESLFSLDVPAGYTVQQQAMQVDLSKKPISYLAETLKFVAEHNDGVFPVTLHGEDGIEGVTQRAMKESAEKSGKVSTEEALKRISDLAMKLGGAFGFLYSLSPENDWHYAGKDVKLNTPDRAIFWYKPHKASTTYQVLYADLSVKEVPREEAPKLPPIEESPKR